MLKVLYLGDPHVVSANLDESDRLMEHTCKMVLEHKVDRIVILGDLFNTFGVVRVEVLNFWKEWLKTLSDICSTYVLVGNHDKKNQSNDSDSDHALEVFKLMTKQKNLKIIDVITMSGPFIYVPYIHDKQRFIDVSNSLASDNSKTLICHTEFDGAQYENGYYCKDGIKASDLNYDLVISGHIHKRSRFDKVIYPGTARWLTSSDANQEKGLWLVDHEPTTGAILKEEFLDTSSVCTPIYSYQYKEGGSEPVIPKGSRASVELIGSSEWIRIEKPKFKGVATISSKITDKKSPRNSKSGSNLEFFIKNVFEPKQGLTRANLMDYMKGMGIL